MTSGIRCTGMLERVLVALLSCHPERSELNDLAWSLWSADRPEAKGWTRVSMLGAPGSGKTRLQCAVVRSLLPNPPTLREGWLPAWHLPSRRWRALSSSLLADVNPRLQLPACRPQDEIDAKPGACGIAPTAPSRAQLGHRSLRFTDISTSRRPDHQLRHLRAAFYQVIQNACNRAGLARGDCKHKDGTDGVLVIAAAEPTVPLNAPMTWTRAHSNVGASAQPWPEEAIHAGLAVGRSARADCVAGVETYASASQSPAAEAFGRFNVRSTRQMPSDLPKYPTGQRGRRICHRQPTAGMVNRVDALSRHYRHSGHLHPTGDPRTHPPCDQRRPKAELPHRCGVVRLLAHDI
jgi:hypothetical protein